MIKYLSILIYYIIIRVIQINFKFILETNNLLYYYIPFYIWKFPRQEWID